MPLTVLGGQPRVGYARAVEALLRAASERTRYPRRDAVVLMQADFTDRPEQLVELVKRFEGGADVVAAERVGGPSAPRAVRTFARLTRWLRALWPVRAFVTVPGVKDPFGGFRLLRISVVRELLTEGGARGFGEGSVPAANVELLRAAAHCARRIETVAVEPRWDLRPRGSRLRPWPETFDLVRRGWEGGRRGPPGAGGWGAPGFGPRPPPDGVRARGRPERERPVGVRRIPGVQREVRHAHRRLRTHAGHRHGHHPRPHRVAAPFQRQRRRVAYPRERLLRQLAGRRDPQLPPVRAGPRRGREADAPRLSD